MRNKLFYGIAFLMTALVMICSCQYKDLDDEQLLRRADLHITFDWSAVDSVPERMRVAFYPLYEANRGYTFFDVYNRDTVVSIGAGTYAIVSWNKDTEHVRTDGYNSHQSIFATTLPYAAHGNYTIPTILDSIFPGQRTLDYPDYMVHYFQSDYNVSLDSDSQVVNIRPDSMVVTIDIHIGGVSGLDICRNIRGVMGNIAGKRYIAPDNMTEDRVNIIYDAGWNEQDSTVNAHFWVFGKELTNSYDETHKMVLFFWLRGGNVYVTMDISNSLGSYSLNDKRLHIEIPDLDIDLHDYVHNDTIQGGFDIDVGDWNNASIDLGF